MSSSEIPLQILDALVDELISLCGATGKFSRDDKACDPDLECNIPYNTMPDNYLWVRRKYNDDKFTFYLDLQRQEAAVEYWNIVSIHDPEFMNKLLTALKNRIAFSERNTIPFMAMNLDRVAYSDLNAIL